MSIAGKGRQGKYFFHSISFFITILKISPHVGSSSYRVRPKLPWITVPALAKAFHTSSLLGSSEFLQPQGENSLPEMSFSFSWERALAHTWHQTLQPNFSRHKSEQFHCPVFFFFSEVSEERAHFCNWWKNAPWKSLPREPEKTNL